MNMNDKNILKAYGIREGFYKIADRRCINFIHTDTIIKCMQNARKDERKRMKKEVEDLPRWEPSVVPFWKGAIMKCEDKGRYVNIINILNVLLGGEIKNKDKEMPGFFRDLFGLPRKKEKA